MLYVSSSISINSGIAPAWEIASVAAMNVCGTVRTTSPPLYTGSHDGESQCVGATTEGYRVTRVAEGGEGPLELLHHGAAYKPCCKQGSAKYACQLLFRVPGVGLLSREKECRQGFCQGFLKKCSLLSLSLADKTENPRRVTGHN